jgi:phage shock protein A
MDAYKRMEDKVNQLEASAEVSAEMGSLSSGKMLGGSDIEKEFALLESSSSVDDELKKMKGLLGGSAEGGGAEKKDSMDDELEKLKRDAGL